MVFSSGRVARGVWERHECRSCRCTMLRQSFRPCTSSGSWRRAGPRPCSGWAWMSHFPPDESATVVKRRRDSSSAGLTIQRESRSAGSRPPSRAGRRSSGLPAAGTTMPRGKRPSCTRVCSTTAGWWRGYYRGSKCPLRRCEFAAPLQRRQRCREVSLGTVGRHRGR
jgi:hypothetical protein